MPISSLSAARAIQNGRYAEAAVGGVLIAFLTEWDVKVNTDTADTTAHGDGWQYNQALDSGWVFSAKQWVPALSVNHTINLLYSSSGIPARRSSARFVANFSIAALTSTSPKTGDAMRNAVNVRPPLGDLSQ